MDVERVELTWEAVRDACERIAAHHARDRLLSGVYGVPRGGCVPAAIIATSLRVPLLAQPRRNCLVVDDLLDSGATAALVLERADQVRFAALYRKRWSPVLGAPEPLDVGDAWLVFPWEVEDAPPLADALLRLLQAAGFDTSSPEMQARAGELAPAVARSAFALLHDQP